MSKFTKEEKELLEMDPLGLAEEITGKRYNADPATSAMGMLLHQAKSAAVEKIMKERMDTYYRIPWADFLNLIKLRGFDIIWKGTVEHSNGPSPSIVAVHPKDRLVLTADCYQWQMSEFKDSLNSANLYCLMEGSLEARWAADPNCSSTSHPDLPYSEDDKYNAIPKDAVVDENRYYFAMWIDAREGIFSKIEAAKAAGGKFINPERGVLPAISSGKYDSETQDYREWCLENIRKIPELKEYIPHCFAD